MNTSVANTDPSDTSRSIWVFTPSRTDPADLEAILVQRHDLLKDAVERVRESALTANKHHLLFVGPRGCGKTHLVTLIVSRISADAEASRHLRLAWLNEDETCTSLLELLIKVHAALGKRYPDGFRDEDLSRAYDLKAAAALDFVAKQLLAGLGSKTLVIVTENLDALFESMGEQGQKQLRAFIQEHPQFSIVATAQRLVEDLADRTSPFFGFFQTEHLKPLTVEQATKLLQNIARVQGRTEVTEFLDTSRGRSRVRALHHLSGGNHRIYIVLSQFITRETLDALIGPFLKMVDELTPYYQERLRWLPPLQRKIVELLCTCETTVPVKEIARRLFSTPQTISSQLQELREKGYVESSQRGRESLYEISEPLMRICVEVKENQNTQPLRLLVDFLRVWYDDVELKRRLGLQQAGSSSYSYLSAALERNAKEGNLRIRFLIEDVFGSEASMLDQADIRQLSAELAEEVLIIAKCIKDGDAIEAHQYIEEVLDSDNADNIKADVLLLRAPLYGNLGELAMEIIDYTRVIELDGAMPNQVANAYINRGVVFGQQGDSSAEIADYTRVIELPGALPDQVAKALVNRGITYDQQGNSMAAIADYTRVVELPGAPPDQVAKALVNRGIMHGEQGDRTAEIADYTRVIELPDAPLDQIAKALFNRGLTYREQGDNTAAITDFTKVIELPDVPLDQIAKALVNRGTILGEQSDRTAAIADYTQVIELSGAPPDQIAKALLNRGIIHGRQGDSMAEIADYTRVIELPGASLDHIAKALVNRAITHGQQGNSKAEIADYTRAIELSGSPPHDIAKAYINRGVVFGQQGDSTAEIADYTRVIELPGVLPDQVAKALVNRGITHDQQGNSIAAIADYTRVVELPGAPPDQVAKALLNRGVMHGQRGDSMAAIADYTRAIELYGARPNDVAIALVNRAILHGQQGDSNAANADYTRVIELPGAPPDHVSQALFNRGVLRFHAGNKNASRVDLEALTRMSEAREKIIADSHLALAELDFSEGKWTEGFEAIAASLVFGAKLSTPYFIAPVDVIGVLFNAGLNLEGRSTHAATLFVHYATHSALAVLGEALVKHLGSVFARGEPWPASDNLDQWLAAWEQAAGDSVEFKLPLRLMRIGIAFIKSGGKDPAILLSLTSTERSLLRQALGLEPNDET